MRGAAVEFAAELSRIRLRSPQTPLFGSTGDRIVDANAAAKALAGQIASTVLWDQVLESVYARNVGCVLEVGPGAVLASMWNQRFPEIPARSADEFSDAGAIVDWMERRSA
jgi:[acyl-carrier-protein] S-malonyltransferase